MKYNNNVIIIYATPRWNLILPSRTAIKIKKEIKWYKKKKEKKTHTQNRHNNISLNNP